jgi:hypothetical protein
LLYHPPRRQPAEQSRAWSTHSASSSRAAWKMRATSLHWSVCMTEPRTSY